MGESHWDRKRRHLNEDHEFRRKQSKRTMGLIKSQERIDRLTDAIDDAGAAPASERPVSKEFTRLGVEWMRKKTSILAAISGNPFLTDSMKAEWCQMLQAQALTEDDDADLTGLRGRVLLESVKFDGRLGRSASMTELVGDLETLIGIRVQARAHW